MITPTFWMIALAIALIVSTAGLATPAKAKPYVDLELVLAVDISLSMDTEEQQLQRDGYVAAFKDPRIIKAIQSGPNARIAVTYVEWAGAGVQQTIVPWRVIGTVDEAAAFADELASKPIRRARMTSISGVLRVSMALFKESPVQGLRRVIDVSGDGPNNSGWRIERTRDATVAAGIVINGLAIRIKRGTGLYVYFDLPDLDKYYKDCVIGGPGSFVLTIRKRSEFATAIRQKLLLEIAGHQHPEPPRLLKTQLTPPVQKYDCLIGEKMWREYYLENGDPL